MRDLQGSGYPKGRFYRLKKEIHIINTSAFQKSAIIAMFCRLESYTE